MPREKRYVPGDNWVIDDETGLKIRSSEARTQWDGTVVDRDHYAPRHPQDFVRARADNQAASLVRSEPPEEFVGPVNVTITEAAGPNNLYVRVSSVRGMAVGDRISIMLDGGDTFRTTIKALYAIGFLMTEDGRRLATESGDLLLWEMQSDNSKVIGFNDPLPEGVSIGNVVVDNTAGPRISHTA